MKYIIFCSDKTCFTTYWFTQEMFNPDTMLMVVDLAMLTYTNDGKEWKDVNVDHL